MNEIVPADESRPGGGSVDNPLTINPEGEHEMRAAAEAVAEIQAAYTMALRNQRDEDQCFERVVATFDRFGMAEASIYKFPRGGQDIEGKSVGLARECARIWKNVRYGCRVVRETADNVQLRACAVDLETGTFAELEDTFSKRIQRKVWDEGSRRKVTQWVRPDERDLRELLFRRGAILERNCLLKVLPRWLTDEAFRVAKARRVNPKGLSTEERCRQAITAFKEIGVTVEMLNAWAGGVLSRKANNEMLAELQGIYQSIHDGNSHVEEHFDPEPSEVQEKPKPKGKGADKPKAEPKPKPKPEKPTSLTDLVEQQEEPPFEPDPEPEPEPDPELEPEEDPAEKTSALRSIAGHLRGVKDDDHLAKLTRWYIEEYGSGDQLNTVPLQRLVELREEIVDFKRMDAEEATGE